MQMTKELAFVSAEINELQRILERIPKEKVITRKSYEYRLAQAQEALSKIEQAHMPESLVITFKGKPVRGTHAINADFMGKATSAFSEAFAALVANIKGIPLGGSGPIPEYDKHQLCITGIAKGSFGFTLELPREELQDQESLLDVQQSPIQLARNALENVLSQAIQGNDDELAESLAGLEQRTIKSVQKFFETMQKNEAFFTLKSSHREICSRSQDEIQMATNRLASENVHDSERTFEGQLMGVLPAFKEFQFTLTDGSSIKGKILMSAFTIDDFRDKQYKTCRIALQSRVIGQGKPRYSLRSFDDITLI